MILIVCPVCRLAFRTVGEFEEVDYLVGTKSEWYPDRYPCPQPDCGGQMVLTDTIASEDLPHLEIHELTPHETYQCLHGQGLPEEKNCKPEVVKALLEQHVITSVSVSGMLGTKRTLINYITMASGHRLYLASTPAGPVVYRIATPRVWRELDSE